MNAIVYGLTDAVKFHLHRVIYRRSINGYYVDRNSMMSDGLMQGLHSKNELDEAIN